MPGADRGDKPPSTPPSGSDDLFTALRSLGESNYAEFVERRSSLIRTALATLAAPGGDADGLLAVQTEIDRRRALRVAPEQALAALLPLLSERVDELRYWAHRLELEAAIATRTPAQPPRHERRRQPRPPESQGD